MPTYTGSCDTCEFEGDVRSTIAERNNIPCPKGGCAGKINRGPVTQVNFAQGPNGTVR